MGIGEGLDETSYEYICDVGKFEDNTQIQLPQEHRTLEINRIRRVYSYLLERFDIIKIAKYVQFRSKRSLKSG